MKWQAPVRHGRLFNDERRFCTVPAVSYPYIELLNIMPPTANESVLITVS
ncbi:hypothetical protein JW948_15535 [bacterium]|nr:hypothetical protein [bacterium]